MNIEENKSLKELNTFGMDVTATYYVHISTHKDMEKAVSFAKEKKLPLLVLSGGSNMLFTEDINAVVLHMDTHGIEIIAKEGDDTLVRVKAGENWHRFVMWSIQNDLAGAENLAFIPGRVGSSPVQNIGAYGVEAKDVIERVEAYDIHSGKTVVFSNAECHFGYRESVFKGEKKGQYIITNVVFRLHDPQKYSLKLDYGNIRSELEKRGISNPSIADVATVVTDIRMAKLPDPEKIGNCGSFFKNPVLDKNTFDTLKEKYTDMPSFDVPNSTDTHYRKVPAAWLIDRAGWKGYRRGSVGVHENQALVLVHYGGGTGAQVMQLCRDICQDVKEKYSVEILPEVNIIDTVFLKAIK